MEKDLIIPSRQREVGSIMVARSIPSAQKRNVGPFVFLDQMGPMIVDETHFLDVNPHPHIGLATVTYLFQGRGFHKDSIGSKQIISPGDLNWMTAGKGIVHSERSPDEDKSKVPHPKLHGVQIWVGLPKEFEETDPSFTHYGSDHLSKVEFSSDLQGKVLIGEHKGKSSPVKTHSPMLFMELISKGEGQELLSFKEQEIGIFLVSGVCSVNNQNLEKSDLIIVADPSNALICFSKDARLIVIGGEPFPEPRYIWWNFISSRKERIHEAAEAWKNQQMGVVAGETGYTPLPSDPLPKL